MLEFINSLFNQVDPLSAYLVLGLSAFVENTVPPIPGDTVTVLGAYLVSIGKLNFWGVYISTTIGSVLGFFFMYVLGLRFGRSILKSRLSQKIFSETQLKKTELWFGRYGYWMIAANRFLSGTRSVISLFTGFFHLKWYLVLGLAFLSAAVWNALLISAGYLLGENWELVTGIIAQYNKIVIVVTIGLIIYFIIRRKRAASLPKETE
ncbi:MAG TPA: DedA family protein [Caldithrix abyssi]|uniref:DedA family protein n=1 Tax=Caldithrix abyssi TaxID=187145 RepID=A0A7V4TZV9_CALAY|nr:DedA family protein [Caldithrix abyssi]